MNATILFRNIIGSGLKAKSDFINIGNLYIS